MLEIRITLIADSPNPPHVIATSVTLIQSPPPRTSADQEGGAASTVELTPEQVKVLRNILAVLPIKDPPR